MADEAIRQLLDVGSVGIIVILIVVFIDRRFWPWYTKEYWPARQKQQDLLNEALNRIRETMEAMRILQDVASRDSTETRSTMGLTVERLLTNQTTMIGTLLRLESRVDTMIEVSAVYLDKETLTKTAVPPTTQSVVPPEGGV